MSAWSVFAAARGSTGARTSAIHAFDVAPCRLRALDAVRRHLERPCQHQRDGEAYKECGDDHAIEPLRQADGAFQHVGKLQQHPTHDRVDAGNPNYVPAL